jgi:hypothetical protein
VPPLRPEILPWHLSQRGATQEDGRSTTSCPIPSNFTLVEECRGNMRLRTSWLVVFGLLITSACTNAGSPCSWRRVSTPDLGPDGGQLSRVLAFSDSDVWAVGSSRTEFRPTISHWDGRAWTSVATPLLDARTNYVSTIAATGPDDVWATGISYPGESDSRSHPFMLHWDGRVWSATALPLLQALRGGLTSLAAIAHDDVWAVGFYGSRGDQALALHWDGHSWQGSPLPLPRTGGGIYQTLVAVAAGSSSDVWAVGRDQGGLDDPLLRWDGESWKQVKIPSRETFVQQPPHLSPGQIEAVIPMGPKDVWFLGSATQARIVKGEVQTLGLSIPMFLHWDGQSWKLSETRPQFDRDDWFQFEGATLGADGSAWVVGSLHPGQSAQSQPITYKLQRSDWVPVGTPFISPAPLHMDDFRSNGLISVSVTAAGRAWAVGQYYTADSLGTLPLVERCS